MGSQDKFDARRFEEAGRRFVKEIEKVGEKAEAIRSDRESATATAAPKRSPSKYASAYEELRATAPHLAKEAEMLNKHGNYELQSVCATILELRDEAFAEAVAATRRELIAETRPAAGKLTVDDMEAMKHLGMSEAEYRKYNKEATR